MTGDIMDAKRIYNVVRRAHAQLDDDNFKVQLEGEAVALLEGLLAAGKEHWAGMHPLQKDPACTPFKRRHALPSNGSNTQTSPW